MLTEWKNKNNIFHKVKGGERQRRLKRMVESEDMRQSVKVKSLP